MPVKPESRAWDEAYKAGISGAPMPAFPDNLISHAREGFRVGRIKAGIYDIRNEELDAAIRRNSLIAGDF